jgi:hypothetical protein
MVSEAGHSIEPGVRKETQDNDEHSPDETRLNIWNYFIDEYTCSQMGGRLHASISIYLVQ